MLSVSWIENERSASFEHEPITGLFFISGNQLAHEYRRDWTEGQKCPMIAFPSGLECELWESGNAETIAIVHIFGELDLPLADTRDRAYEQAAYISEQCGYFVSRVEDDKLEVWGHDTHEHVLIEYNDEAGRMVNVSRVREEKSRPRLPLLDEESRKRLPPLYANEELGLNAQAQVKFFTPDSNWTWYASEFDGEDIFFGLVVGLDIELGYFSLSELEAATGPMGLPIERDKYFKPATLRELRDSHYRE